ncbi:MAG: hypothetical protein K0S04_2315 [Herbinix sp.]|jgi:hypothetical protein|nr:hypothetical protein [Herbinix sp.]
MDSCELASTVTALACFITNCVPKEDLPLFTAILGQLASTLATITVNENALKSRANPIEEPPVEVDPGLSIIS